MTDIVKDVPSQRCRCVCVCKTYTLTSWCGFCRQGWHQMTATRPDARQDAIDRWAASRKD